MKKIREHEKIPYAYPELMNRWEEGMRLPNQKPGLDRWFFHWQWDSSSSDKSEGNAKGNTAGYYASYFIGAQWVAKGDSLVVTTKEGCDKIDFLEMFSVCFNSGIASDEFSRIYEVDMEQPTIEAPELKSVLSPLIVVHFLSVVQRLVKRGLKKDYVQCGDNLNKVRGHISVLCNERTNVMQQRFDRIFCNYQQYTVNNPENRLIKKALLFSKNVLQRVAASKGMKSLMQNINLCLSVFNGVDEQIEVWEVKNIKHHKLFKEYGDAIRLAQMILRQYDYSITNIDSWKNDDCPVFWLDMSLLYEHYVWGLLKEAYGEKIHYQKYGYTGYPDFICYEPKMVMDTKYIPRLGQSHIDTYIIRQLSGYARDKHLFKELSAESIPCIVIYPEQGRATNPFKSKNLNDLLKESESYAWNFYKVAVPLPTLE